MSFLDGDIKIDITITHSSSTWPAQKMFYVSICWLFGKLPMKQCNKNKKYAEKY